MAAGTLEAPNTTAWTPQGGCGDPSPWTTARIPWVAAGTLGAHRITGPGGAGENSPDSRSPSPPMLLLQGGIQQAFLSLSLVGFYLHAGLPWAPTGCQSELVCSPGA